MSAGIFNLTGQFAVEQGSDFSFSFIYKDVNGDPVDLTDATLTGSIRQDWNTSSLASFVLTKHAPATDGYVGVSLPASSSNSIPPGQYKYDIRISNDGVDHVIKGSVEVLETVTHA